MNSLEKLRQIAEDFNNELEESAREKRINIIAQNGNDGEHYNLDEESEQPNKAVTEDRKSIPVYSGVLTYFPDALKEVSKCSLAGQKQHNHGDSLYWDKSKSLVNEDALVRHLIDHSLNPIDDDGVLHLAKVAWRALASLQVYLDNK